MSEFTPHQAELATCQCTLCVLINCGAFPADWAGWKDVWLAGEARVILTHLTQQEPPVWPGPRQ